MLKGVIEPANVPPVTVADMFCALRVPLVELRVGVPAGPPTAWFVIVECPELSSVAKLNVSAFPAASL